MFSNLFLLLSLTTYLSRFSNGYYLLVIIIIIIARTEMKWRKRERRLGGVESRPIRNVRQRCSLGRLFERRMFRCSIGNLHYSGHEELDRDRPRADRVERPRIRTESAN